VARRAGAEFRAGSRSGYAIRAARTYGCQV